MIICLETSGPVCSVALCSRDGVVGLRESNDERSHAARLTVYVKELLAEAGIKAADLSAVAVSKGPGSYTGLRIGVSAAKGIAYGASIPLIGIETTLSMYNGISDEERQKFGLGHDSLLIPAIDARRMEVYYSVLSRDGKIIKDVSADIIGEESFLDIPEEIRILIFGDGAFKCSQVMKRSNTVFFGGFRVSAAHMHKPSYEALKAHRFEDTAYFEPFYLKDFITSQPKKNILGK